MSFLATLTDYFRLTVPGFIPMGLTAALAGYVFSSLVVQFDSTLLFALLSIAFVIAGYNSFNAILDLGIDKINKPHRPLPRGVISPKEAFYAATLFFAVSFVFAYFVNLFFLLIIGLSATLALLYSFPGVYLKRRFIAGTFVANVLYTLCFPLAGWAVKPENPLPWSLLLFLFLFGFGTAVLKDFEDVPGDSKYNIKTFPTLLGHSETIVFSVSCFVFSIFLLGLLLTLGLFPPIYLGVSVFVFLALANVYLLFHKRTSNEAKNTFLRGIFILIFLELSFVAFKLIF